MTVTASQPSTSALSQRKPVACRPQWGFPSALVAISLVEKASYITRSRRQSVAGRDLRGPSMGSAWPGRWRGSRASPRARFGTGHTRNWKVWRGQMMQSEHVKVTSRSGSGRLLVPARYVIQCLWHSNQAMAPMRAYSYFILGPRVSNDGCFGAGHYSRSQSAGPDF